MRNEDFRQAVCCSVAHEEIATMSRIIFVLALISILSGPGRADSGSAVPAAGCQDEAVKIRLLVLHVAKEDVRGAQTAVSTMKGVRLVESVPDTQLLCVLSSDVAVTPERVVKFLALGGYEAREANEREVGLGRNSLEGGVVTIRGPGGAQDQQEKTGGAAFPDTTAGRLARGYIEAFNSGDAEALHAFDLKNRSKSALESQAKDERIKQYKELFASLGVVEVRGVEHMGEREITVEIFSRKNDTGFRAAFELEDGTDKLNLVRLTMMDVALPDATPDPDVKVTSIADSIEPLRTRFNQHRGKPRFVAILSPT